MKKLISQQDVLNEIVRFSTEEGASVECQQLYCDVLNMPDSNIILTNATTERIEELVRENNALKNRCYVLSKLKAHSDGANEVIDRIKEAREEVANYSDFHREHLYKTNPNYDVEQGQYLAYEKCLQILDKLIAEVEETK